MINTWNVIWWQNGKKYIRRFPGDKPSESGAIAFGKQLQGQGITPHVSSSRKAFAIPVKMRIPPEDGMVWCPYCMKWKHFVEKSIRHDNGVIGPAAWRCPICTISIHDFFVRMWSPMMVARLEGRRVKIPSEKAVAERIRTTRGKRRA